MGEETKDAITAAFTAFVRQRRNFIAISLVLIFWELADVSVGEIHVLNASLVIGRTSAVVYALWIAWVYWGWRYLQRLLEIRGLTKLSSLFLAQLYEVVTILGKKKLAQSTVLR